jgi:hypothetical protein
MKIKKVTTVYDKIFEIESEIRQRDEQLQMWSDIVSKISVHTRKQISERVTKLAGETIACMSVDNPPKLGDVVSAIYHMAYDRMRFQFADKPSRMEQIFNSGNPYVITNFLILIGDVLKLKPVIIMQEIGGNYDCAT